MSVFRDALDEQDWSGSRKGLVDLSKQELIDVIIRMGVVESEQAKVGVEKIDADFKAGNITAKEARDLLRKIW